MSKHSKAEPKSEAERRWAQLGPWQVLSLKRCKEQSAKRRLGMVECKPYVVPSLARNKEASPTSAGQPSVKHCRCPRPAEDVTQQKYPRWCSSGEFANGRLVTWVP